MSHTKPKRPVWGTLKTARKALSRWKLSGDASISYVHFGENATWKVKTGDEVYALRVYRPDRWTSKEMEVEHTLMNSLGENFGVGSPIPGCDRLTLQPVPDEGLFAALFPWVKGRLLYRKVTPKMITRLGRFMGEMHSHILDMPVVDSSKRWDDTTLLMGQVEIIERVLPEIGFERSAFRFLRKKVERFLQKWKEFDPLTALVHSDLHLGNLKWTADRLYPIDFDDCGIAPLPYDLAIPASCFGGLSGKTNNLELFLKHYNRLGPGEVVLEELRLFMAIRRVWIMGWCCDRQDIFSGKSLVERCETNLNVLREYE